MTADELKTVLEQTATMLEENQAVVTPAALDAAAILLADAAKFKATIAGLTGMSAENIDALFTAAAKGLEIEKRLTQTSLTNTLVEVLRGISVRKRILGLISLFL